MWDIFDEIFSRVMVEKNLDWWELFESDDFEIVIKRVQAVYGDEIIDSEEWKNWIRDMAEEL